MFPFKKRRGVKDLQIVSVRHPCSGTKAMSGFGWTELRKKKRLRVQAKGMLGSQQVQFAAEISFKSKKSKSHFAGKDERCRWEFSSHCNIFPPVKLHAAAAPLIVLLYTGVGALIVSAEM